MVPAQLVAVAAAMAAYSPMGAPRAHAPARRCVRPSMGEASLVLTEENVQSVLEDCQQTLGAVFGTDSASRDVGITGRVSLVELDGPIVVVSLSGRFWHQRSVVIDRVSSYVMERIPECVGVEIDDVAQLDDSIVE